MMSRVKKYDSNAQTIVRTWSFCEQATSRPGIKKVEKWTRTRKKVVEKEKFQPAPM